MKKNFAYWSTACVMLVLVVSAQIVVQIALQNEISARSFATNLARQRGRAYGIVFDAVHLQHDQEHKGLYLQKIAEADRSWEEIQKWAYTIHIDPDIEAQIQASKPHFVQMSAAITDMLLVEASPRPASLDADIGVLLVHIDPYQAIFFAIFNTLSAKADRAVLNVRVIETVLCLLTLGTMAFEYFCIVQPQRKREAALLFLPSSANHLTVL